MNYKSKVYFVGAIILNLISLLSGSAYNAAGFVLLVMAIAHIDPKAFNPSKQ